MRLIDHEKTEETKETPKRVRGKLLLHEVTEENEEVDSCENDINEIIVVSHRIVEYNDCDKSTMVTLLVDHLNSAPLNFFLCGVKDIVQTLV